VQLAPSLEAVRTPTVRRAGIMDVLLALWLWALLFTTYGPKEIQARFHYVPQVLLAVIAVPLVIRRLARGQLLIPTGGLLYIAWAVWSFTGIFVAKYERLFWSSYGRTWKLFVLFLLVSWAVDSYRRLRILLLVGFTGGMCVAAVAPLFGFSSYEQMAGEFGGRATGALGNPNTLSHLATIGFMSIILAIATARGLVTKVLWAMLLAIPLYLAWVTGSRNAWAALVLFGIMAYFFYLRPQLRGHIGAKLGAVISIAVAIVGGTALMLAYSQFASRFDSLIEFLTTGETRRFARESHVVAMFAEWRMFANNMALGVGLGQDYLRLPEYGGQRLLFIHSDLSGLGGIVGLPGLVLYYAILGTITYRCWKTSKHPMATPVEQKVLLLATVFMATDIARTLFVSIYGAKIAWVLWAGIAGYATSISYECATRARQPHAELTPGPATHSGVRVQDSYVAASALPRRPQPKDAN